MEDQPLIVLVGSSLLTDGVAAGLANSWNQRLIQIEADCCTLCDRLIALDPDLIVFEVDLPLSKLMSALDKAKSELLLIGLDQQSCQAIVMNCCRHVTLSMADLYRLIQNEVQHVLPT